MVCAIEVQDTVILHPEVTRRGIMAEDLELEPDEPVELSHKDLAVID